MTFRPRHFVIYCEDEPIGATRIRWFNGFARSSERAFRQAYRNRPHPQTDREFIFEHVARKGLFQLVTLAQPKYAAMWVRVLGFRQILDRPPTFRATASRLSN